MFVLLGWEDSAYENDDCEIMRRRAAALAYAREAIKQLPKGAFRLDIIWEAAALELRSLSDMQVLIRTGTCIKAEVIGNLMQRLAR